MKSKLSTIRRSKLFLGGVGLFGFSGFYMLTSDTEIFRKGSKLLDTSVLRPIRTQIIDPIDEKIKEARISTKYALDGIGGFVGDIVDSEENVPTQDTTILSTIYEGGKEILTVIKNLIQELVSFLVEKFVPYVQNHTADESFEILKSYIEPINHAFNRPNTERLQSAKNRLQQYLNAFKTPDFWKSLPAMHNFYMEFKDQIASLTEDQLSEVIDIYLDDPQEMYKKVTLVMEAMKDDKDVKSKFTTDLMMDFVRGENIDVMKARLAAAKVSAGVNNIFSALGFSKDEVNPKDVEDKISSVFSRVAQFFA